MAVVSSPAVPLRRPFPRELRLSLGRSFDRRFALVMGGLCVVVFPTIFLLSLRELPKKEVTQAEIMLIQERYAKLVLNQEIPKPKEKEKVAVAKVNQAVTPKGGEGMGGEDGGGTLAGREESVAGRAQRKAATAEHRAQKRAKMAAQVGNLGIFAALTSSSGSGGRRSGAATGLSNIQDLLGGSTITQSFGGLDLGSGGMSFAVAGSGQRVAGPSEVAPRGPRGTRASGSTLSESQLGMAQTGSIQTTGEVTLSQKEVEVEGQAAGNAARTAGAISQVLQQEQKRLTYLFEKYLKKDPKIGGKIILEIFIAPSGEITSVNVISSTITDQEFERDLLRRIKLIRFTAIDPSSGDLKITVPFIFTGKA